LLRLTRRLLVKLKKINDRSRIATTHAAFGANPKAIDCSFGRLDTLARPLNSVAQMQQAVKLRAWLKLQMTQRREIGGVGTVARDRQVNPFDRSFNARAYAVGNLHKICRVFGIDKMPVSTVAVTQVIAKMDVRRNRIAELAELIKNSGLPISGGRRKQALPKGELKRYVPLNGQFGVGNFLGDLLQLAHNVFA
jgi:hypothetical protein